MRMAQDENTECPVALTVDVIGSSWTCLILRDLLLHRTRRLQDFQISLEGIAPTTLSDRLKNLEQKGILGRRIYSMSPPRAAYVLTEEGRSPWPIISPVR